MIVDTLVIQNEKRILEQDLVKLVNDRIDQFEKEIKVSVERLNFDFIEISTFSKPSQYAIAKCTVHLDMGID